MLTLTKHFIKNWGERVGGKPDIDQVQDIIRNSIIIQSCRTMTRQDGRPYRLLAIYWHTERDLIIKVDEFSGNVVTVMSKALRRAA
jgi:hypothetical protein